MADSKPDPKEGGGGFFRKVVKFVANPATDWADLDTKPAEPAENSLAKAELREMIERKRRNDFVRKREFDLLRKIRREGLSTDGASALATAEDDDSEAPRHLVRSDDEAMKAKIDEIEQQMEGESGIDINDLKHPPGFYLATTVQANFSRDGAPTTQPGMGDTSQPPLESFTLGPAPAPAPAPAARSPALAAAAAPAPAAPVSFSNPFSVEVNEIAHDPALDEAVISFANAEFEHCERALTALIGPEGDRGRHAETWLTLFDLYRATGQQQAFESLALDYVQRFGWSPPQWFSIPQMVADESALKAATMRPDALKGASAGGVGWAAPPRLDVEGVMDLRARTLQMPMPWVLDWSQVEFIEPEGANELTQILRHWARQKIEMRWIDLDRLLSVLGDTAPNGVRDADPVYWLLKLEALRLADRADRFDEIAIDYCVTYEVSPPSWERALCTVKMADSSGMTVISRQSVTDVPTGFADSRLNEETAGVRSATVELTGQLVGDIGPVLGGLEGKLGNAGVVNIHCARLIRMDFVAAGDLLNWVLRLRDENRLVQFEDAHRLVGMFFNAMGINEHARVKVRNL